MEVRVLTVDDQATFRGVARDVIDATPGFEAVGEAASGEEALAAVERLRRSWCCSTCACPASTASRSRGGCGATHPDTLLVLISIEDSIDLPSAAQLGGASRSCASRTSAAAAEAASGAITAVTGTRPLPER